MHLGFVYSGGPRGGSYGLPDGGGWHTLAFMLGLPVAFYSYAGGGFVEPVFRKKWWYALTVTFGTTVGAVSILALGQGLRYWIAAALMTAVGVAAPMANVLVKPQNPGETP